MSTDKKISRRTALKWMGAGTFSLALPALPGCSHFGTRDRGPASATSFDLAGFGPIDRGSSAALRAYAGDNPDRAHSILWNVQGYLSTRSIPRPSEHVEVAIIGGGMSGLISAYTLRDLNTVVFERGDRFGGNSKGQAWNGIDYSIGAAYFVEHDEGTPIEALFKEAGIYELCRRKTEDDPVFVNGKRYKDFWKGSSAPRSARRQFQKLYKHFTSILKNENGLAYPEIPLLNEDDRANVVAFDQYNMLDYATKIAGGDLHPHILTLLEHYSWSTMGASLSEVSAAQYLNEFACEFGPVYVPPGGNAAVAEQFLRKAAEKIPASNLRAGHVVFSVEVVKDGVIVAYETPTGEVRSTHAKSVVMACPKFVVAKILKSIEPERQELISKLRYNAYLVGNALLNTPVKDDFYDLYMLGDAKIDFKNIQQTSDRHGITDVVHGAFAKTSKQGSVISCYRALPFTGGRALIFAPESYESFRAAFENQIREQILPALGVKPETLVDVRVARWGHPMPVATPGLIASGEMEKIRRPFGDRVFFVEQDNWMLPAIETCAEEALHWAPFVRKAALG